MLKLSSSGTTGPASSATFRACSPIAVSASTSFTPRSSAARCRAQPVPGAGAAAGPGRLATGELRRMLEALANELMVDILSTTPPRQRRPGA